MLNQSIHRITSKPSSSKCIKYILKSDVHHGNYNPSHKVKSNMQEDSDGPMTRARGKQLQRALTSQIGMMETASELKISNQFEIGSRVLICLHLELRDGKSP
jgi:hypothetical protein